MAAILVIEDDDATAAAIMAELDRHGHSASRAADGDSGLDLATREAFDAITLDRMLPGLDGLTLVARLRERHITIPVLMLSALSDVDER
ncbi:MAG: response regulator, partial [Sphingomonas parapaucimobilis]